MGEATMTYADWQRERECTRKARHDGQYAANEAVLRVWAAGGYARAYHCTRCTYWHTTSRRAA